MAICPQGQLPLRDALLEFKHHEGHTRVSEREDANAIRWALLFYQNLRGNGIALIRKALPLRKD